MGDDVKEVDRWIVLEDLACVRIDVNHAQSGLGSVCVEADGTFRIIIGHQIAEKFPVGEGFAVGFNYYDLGLTGVYSEKIMRLAAGISLKDTVAAGFSVKSLSQEFTLNDYYTGDAVFSNGNFGSI